MYDAKNNLNLTKFHRIFFIILLNLFSCAPKPSFSINGILQNVIGASISPGLKGPILTEEISLTGPRTSINLGNPVVTTKTLVICSTQYGGSGLGFSNTCTLDESGTNLIIQTGGLFQDSKVRYNILEFNTNLSVVRGTTAFLDNTASKIITLNIPISLSEYLIVSQARASGNQSNADESILIKNKFLNNRQIELRRNAIGVETNTIYQLIKFENSKTQSGDIEIPSGGSLITSTITPVNLEKSILIYSLRANNGVGREADYMIKANFLNNSTIEFSRSGTNIGMDISYFVLEFLGNEKVQSGDLSVGGAQTSVTQTLSTPLKDTSRSLLLFSNSSTSSNNPDEDKQSSSYIGTILNSSTIQFSRNTSNNTSSTISYFIIEFP